MATPSAALISLFNSIVAPTGGALPNSTWCSFDLYTITLFDGQVLRFTTADFDINAEVTGQAQLVTEGGIGLTTEGGIPIVTEAADTSSILFPSGGVLVDQKESKVQAHWKVGFDTDTWTVVFMPRPTDPVTGTLFPDQVGNVPWIEAAHSGYFDFADFQVDRAYFSSMPTWPVPPTGAVPLGTKTIFAGCVAQVDATDLVVVFNVNDWRSILQTSVPLHFYQASCRHNLFGAGCNADGQMVFSSFSVAGVAGAGTTQANIVAPGQKAPPGSGTFALGTIKMTSGLNAGFLRTVSSWDGTNLQLVIPFPFAIIPGDTFLAGAGCNLTQASCAAFGNSKNFGGQPNIPAPEALYNAAGT